MKPRLRPWAAGLIAIGCAGGGDAPALSLATATPTDRFWALVENARRDGTGCERVAERLTDTLATLPSAAITEFNEELTTRLVESYRWDLWAVAYIANGGASDDGFDYFRGWMITRGRARFEHALRDAPSAVEGAPWLGDLECEAVLGVAHAAYENATGQALPRPTVPWPASPTGEAWTEENLEQVYPGLTARVRRR